MLEIAGELAQGVLLTWPTAQPIARAVEHVAIGAAARAGPRAAEVDVASLIPCAVADTAAAARDLMRPAVGLYAGFFPRYNRLLAEAGFGDAVRAIKEAFDRGGREAAAKAVPDELIDAVALGGDARDVPRASRRLSPRGAGAAHREPARVGARTRRRRRWRPSAPALPERPFTGQPGIIHSVRVRAMVIFGLGP